MADNSAVQVAARVRDLVPRERLSGYVGCVDVQEDSVVVGGKRSFGFDYAFAPNCTQTSVYDTAVKPLLEACKQGINVTVLAYGESTGWCSHHGSCPVSWTGSSPHAARLSDDYRPDWIGENVHNGYGRAQQHVRSTAGHCPQAGSRHLCPCWQWLHTGSHSVLPGNIWRGAARPALREQQNKAPNS